jgi:hypothetical protein
VEHVWLIGIDPKDTGRGETPFVRAYADKGAMLAGLDDVIPFGEMASHLVHLVEQQRGRREAFTFEEMMESAPDYAIDEAQLEEDLGWVEAVWLERVAVAPPRPEYEEGWLDERCEPDVGWRRDE